MSLPYIPILFFAWILLCPKTAQRWLTRFGALMGCIIVGFLAAIILAGV
jgi:hypothetical protein